MNTLKKKKDHILLDYNKIFFLSEPGQVFFNWLMDWLTAQPVFVKSEKYLEGKRRGKRVFKNIKDVADCKSGNSN